MKISTIIERAVRLWIRTGDLSKVQSFLDEQNQVPKDLLDMVRKASGLTMEELIDPKVCGSSWGVSRETRPKMTWDLIKENFVRQIKFSEEDAKLWAKNQLSNRRWLGQIRIGKKDAEEMSGIETEKAAKAFASEVLTREWNRQGVRLSQRSAKYIQYRYVETESRGAMFNRDLKLAIKEGYKYCYIPKTEKGHLDECKEHEGKWYIMGVDKIPILPIHPNCRHRYIFTNLKK